MYNFLLLWARSQFKGKQATDEVCLCMGKTKTRDDERECLKKFSSSIIDVSLSNEDTLYIKRIFKNKCGTEKDRKCSFLNESDLAGYTSRKFGEVLTATVM